MPVQLSWPELPKFVETRRGSKSGIFLPQRAHPGDAGHDVRVYIESPPSRDEVEQLCQTLLDHLEDPLYWQKHMPTLDRKPVVRLEKDLPTRETLAEDLERLQQELQKPAVILEPGEAVVLPAGFAVALPQLPPPLAAVMKIVGRSGWAGKDRLCVTNSPGIIDCGYRDEVKIALENRSHSVQIIRSESRVGQALFELCLSFDPAEHVVDKLDPPSRGGFGSTDVR